jgi:hypothetical protein
VGEAVAMARAAISTVGMLFMIEDRMATTNTMPIAAARTLCWPKNPNSFASSLVSPWLRRP